MAVGRKLSPWMRRITYFLAALIVVGALCFIPTGYYITAPMAAIDTATLVQVEGGQQQRERQYMLIVAAQRASLAWWLYAQLDPRATLEKPQEFLGTIPNYQEYLLRTRQMMADSQRTAKAVALQHLGFGRGVLPVGVSVVAFEDEAASMGFLQPGDTLLEVAGRPTNRIQDLSDVMKTVRAGDEVTVVMQRHGQEIRLSVPTKASTAEGREGVASFGIWVRQEFFYDDGAVDVKIQAGPITGPSAGLMFTLQIIDQLTPGGLSPDLRIAGTGTVEVDGRVGRIGGAAQKVVAAEAAGAEVIFVPYDNYREAAAAATTIKVVPVQWVTDALLYLEKHGRK